MGETYHSTPTSFGLIFLVLSASCKPVSKTNTSHGQDATVASEFATVEKIATLRKLESGSDNSLTYIDYWHAGPTSNQNDEKNRRLFEASLFCKTKPESAWQTLLKFPEWRDAVYGIRRITVQDEYLPLRQGSIVETEMVG